MAGTSTPGESSDNPVEEVRINPNASDASHAVTRQVASQVVGDDTELRTVLRAVMANYQKANINDVPVIIDSEARVPWKEVVNVLSLCRLEGLTRLEFARAAAKV